MAISDLVNRNSRMENRGGMVGSPIFNLDSLIRNSHSLVTQSALNPLTSVPFEVLNFPFVLFRLFSRLESSQVPTLAGLSILLSGVQPVLSGLQLADHAALGLDALRLAALLRACRDSARCDAAEWPSRFNAFVVAFDRRGDGACVDGVSDFFCPRDGSFTPAFRAFDKPMAIACLSERAPCLLSRI